MSPLEDPALDSDSVGRSPGRTLILAAGALDADGLLAPAAMIVDRGRVTAIGRPPEIGSVGEARVVDLPNDLLLPVFVNAHVHLDLWSVGEVSIDEGFDRWLEEIRERRPSTKAEIERSVREAIEASVRGGVGAVGDIAGAFGIEAAAAFDRGPLAGTSFVEVFGIGRRRADGLAAVARLADVARGASAPGRIGLSPHAPYSCAPEVFAAAAATALPVSTHLAETPEETLFTREGQGPFADLLRRVGSLGPEDACPIDGRHPVELLAGIEPARPWLAAHVNYLTEPEEGEEAIDARADLLRRRGITVVWCPRAARFLGHPRSGRAPHPWRALRRRGVRVAIGTDGRPCLDRGDRLSTLDDVRMMIRDGADPVEAMAMATVEGAIGLGLDPQAVRFRGGAAAGLLALRLRDGHADGELTADAMTDSMPRWLVPLDRGAFGEVRLDPDRPGANKTGPLKTGQDRT